ncbi:hypothetical protein KI688_003004 [Linnemannia hyalina]|uniref:F-box domain-containing protein n=1 Tax=Linnemannia hyalina TaxID=64524 RepID=A0A9P7XP22_9FUNG|nr:hypothetical protein KI688_003004 [Linnemannia hyalina]
MNSAKPSPSLATFSCPELCHIIAKYLNQTDLYRCLLVNKTFSKNLHPFFWRHISFSDWVPYYSEFYYLDKKQKELGQSGVDASEDKTSTSASSTSQTPKRERQERPVINRRIPNPWAATAELHDNSEFFLPPQPSFASLTLHGHLVEILTLEWDEGQNFLPQPETSEPEEAPGVTQTWIYIRLLQQCSNIRALKIMGRNTELPWVWPKGMCGNGLGMEIHTKIPQLRVLDISACEYIQNYQMVTLLDRFPGLQVVDFRCREYLTELFADSGLRFDGSHQKSEQAKKFAGTKAITTLSMLLNLRKRRRNM